MAFPQGIDFRGTSGFVTDPTNYDNENGGSSSGQGAAATYPRTSAQGNTVGWETTFNFVDRSSSVNARLAGVNYIGSGGATATYRIDLPATGSYGIQGAFGDQGSAQNTFTIQLEDTTTVFATPVNAQSSTIDQFYAANGTQETEANWLTNNPVAGSGTDEISRTFTTTIFRIKLTGNSGAAVMASIFIRSGGGGGFTPKLRRTLSSVGTRVGVRQPHGWN